MAGTPLGIRMLRAAAWARRWAPLGLLIGVLAAVAYAVWRHPVLAELRGVMYLLLGGGIFLYSEWQRRRRLRRIVQEIHEVSAGKRCPRCDGTTGACTRADCPLRQPRSA